MDTPSIIAALISEDPDHVKEFYAAVAIVNSGKKWLLGLSKAEDDRHNHWCFPGGGIKGTESPEQGAARECKEETGVSAQPMRQAITIENKPGVAFVRCKASSLKLTPNHEFTALGWFTRPEMKSLKLYHNVYQVIDRITRCWSYGARTTSG